MASLMPPGKQQYFDSLGAPLSGGKVYTYVAGTTTPLVTYQDQAATITNSNPVILDSRGEASIFWGATGYKVVLTDSADAAIWTQDNLFAAGVTAADLSYTPAGTGFVVTTIQAKLRQAVSTEDFGAVNDPTVDSTTAIQNALNYAYNSSKGLYVAGRHGATSLTVTMTGNRLNQSLQIFGAGRYASSITKLTGSSPLLTIQSSTPTTAHTAANLLISNMGFFGNAKSCHGIALTSVSNFRLEGLLISGFNSGLPLSSALVGQIVDCEIADNNIGVITRKTGTSSYCNLLTFSGGGVNYNSARGFDLGQGSGIYIGDGIDIERNGAATNLLTGGVIIRNTVDDEFGFAMVTFDKVWFESNLGITIDVESTANLFLNIQNTQMISSEAGLALKVAGARSVNFLTSYAVGNSSTLNLTCDKFTMTNSLADIVNETGVTTSVYNNAYTSGADYISGRTGSFTATLTGCTTSPTGTVTFTRQGKTVTLIVPVITGTSNTTAATLTGMPSGLWPSGNREYVAGCVDNGVEKASQVTVGTTGVITLNNGFAVFTAAGTKGSRAMTLTYEQ